MTNGEVISNQGNPIDRLQVVNGQLVGLQLEIERQLSVLSHVPFNDRIVQDLDEIRLVSDRVRTIAESIFKTAGDVKTELVNKNLNATAVDEFIEIPESVKPEREITSRERDREDFDSEICPEARFIRIRRALKYLDKRETTSKVFHSRIVRKGFGHSLERVSEAQYEDFLDDLDQLVDAGFLESNLNGSTYRLKPGMDIDKITLEEIFMKEGQSIPESNLDSVDTPSLELHEDTLILSGIEQSILMLMVKDGGLRMQDIREQIPQLNSLDTKSSEWLEFKGDFTMIRKKIAEFMIQHQYIAHWSTLGKTRGTRYYLELFDKR